MNTTFDLTKNRKQREFFEKIMKSTVDPTLKYLGYGGGVRGGKTSVSLCGFHTLANKYPNSRWAVIRDSTPNLYATTIPSWEKFFPETINSIERITRGSPYTAHYKNGSKVLFYSQNIKQDSLLNWMLGLETNGILLEQTESLSHKVWERSLERVGSWYIDPMPPSLILFTCNPTQTWIKDLVYNPFKEGRLEAPFYFQQALPSDSPFITDDQWQNWKNMDAVSYAQFIEGDWEAFASINSWAHAFNDVKHTTNFLEAIDTEPIYLSFDFNHAPVTCIIGQHYDQRIHILDEASSTFGLGDLCEKIKEKIGERIVFVTGDRSGWNQSELLEGNRTAYDIIKGKLDLTDYQVESPLSNPNLLKSREQVNGIFATYPHVLIHNKCKQLILDLKFVDADDKHQIKKDRTKETGKADFLDCYRYYINTWFGNYVRI